MGGLIHNKILNVTKSASNGVVNTETIFRFEQEGEMVTAFYSGGEIKKGYLIGLLKNNSLNFRFSQLQHNGKLDGGFSNCTIKHLDNGKICLVEKFNWESRDGQGENMFEEVNSHK